MIAPHLIAPHLIAAPDSSARTVSERTSPPPDAPRPPQSPCAICEAPCAPPAQAPISPSRRWAHNLVLDIVNANLTLPALAAHLKIPFETLVAHIRTPEVQAEIDAYETLSELRGRLLGEAARPIALRKLLDVLETPAPQPTGLDPDADHRALYRHAELIRRAATTIAKESRALMGPSALRAEAPTRTPSVSEQTSSEDAARSPDAEDAHGCAPPDSVVAPAPVRAAGSTDPVNPALPLNPPAHAKPAAPAKQAALAQHARPANQADHAPQPAPPATPPPAPPDSPPSRIPGRAESQARQSPTDALRAAAGSTHTTRDPSRRARDHPAA